jgi:uncharacterized membrane protein YgdD (TMEM256/DUF423 family)
MNRKLVVFSFFLLALTIALGAFGAHALKKCVDANALASYETGVRYQFYGTFILLVLAFRPEAKLHPFRFWIRAFGLGITLFSGSIYALTLGKIFQLNLNYFGPITPIGGAIMMLSLAMLGVRFARNALQE